MSTIAQHEAAELWELSRDHYVSASVARQMAQRCNHQGLRQALQRHATLFQQAAQQLQASLHGQGGHGQGFTHVNIGIPSQAMSHDQLAGNGQHLGHATAEDALIVANCLARCKSMALKCIQGATEAAQPARSLLYQIAGLHLQTAEEYYHWLEQHGLYAAPKADAQTIQQYSQTLQNIANLAQQTVQQPQPAWSQPFA